MIINLKVVQSSYIAGDQLTIADLSILASVTQLEGMDYRITSYPSVSYHISSYSFHISLSMHHSSSYSQIFTFKQPFGFISLLKGEVRQNNIVGSKFLSDPKKEKSELAVWFLFLEF